MPERRSAPISLFLQDRSDVQLAPAAGHINGRFGTHSVDFSGMHGARRRVPNRIDFGRLIEVDPNEEDSY